jgi:hypothetical protein
MIKLSLKDFDANGIAQGRIKGKITVAPSKDLLSQMGGNGIEYMGISIADLALQLDLDVANKKADIGVNLLVDDEVFVGVRLAYKISDAPKFKVPSDSDVVDVDDADEWLESVDIKKFVKTLKDAKLPKELTDIIEEYADQIEDMDLGDINLGGLMGGVSEMPEAIAPEYDYDYDYDYDDYYDDYEYETYEY